MALTYRQLVQEVCVRLDLDDTAGGEFDTTVKRYVNMAARFVWTSHMWVERWKDNNLVTVAPYSTGTAAIANAATALTGSGTIWSATYNKFKFATAYSQPWYRFTRTGNTTGTLDRAYVETTETAATYVLYQDEFDLASDVDTVITVSLYRSAQNPVVYTPLSQLDASAFVHGTTGVPQFWSMTTGQTADTKRIRLYPIPDAAYGLRVQYAKAWTDLSTDGDLHALGANKDLLLIKAAAFEAQAIVGSQRYVSKSEVDQAIADAWSNERPMMSSPLRRRPFDYGTLRSKWMVNLPD